MKAILTRAFLFAVLASFAISCGKKDGSTSTVVDSGTVPAAIAGEVKAKPADLEVLVDLMIAEAQALPRSEFDPSVLAKRLGKDPNAHFEWVRDHTGWAPYRGLLRGYKGVMLDRVGSNLDRAVLLGDLLRRAGHTVRLAHAQLPESHARELLKKIRPIPDPWRGEPDPQPDSVERWKAYYAIYPTDEKELEEQTADYKRRLKEAEALVRSQADRLYAKVKDASKPEGRGDSRALAALRDHWWIEREENGRWIGMDVLLPDSKAGETLAVASGTFAWKVDADLPSIPDSDWHTVRIRIVVERYESGATTESTALETTVRAAEVLDRPITLFHRPDPWPESLPDPTTDPNAIGNAAVNVREWIPVIVIGDDYVTQSGFSEGGDPIADPLNPQRDVAEAGGAGFMSGFGEALGGGETAISSMTAEWIDYEIHVPGEALQRVRRPVFDVLGPSNRAAKNPAFDSSTNDLLIERYEALLSMTDIFLQSCNFTEGFVAHLASRSLIANQAAIRELSRERDPAKASILATSILERLESWGPLPDLAVLRSALGSRSNAALIDRPNILNYRVGTPAVNADRVAIKELIDVASNSTGVRHGSDFDSFEVRLRQGVADTVAEILALGGDVRTAENAASLFEMTARDAGGEVLIEPGDTRAVQNLGWPADAAARLAMDVETGSVVVALNRPISINGRQRVGWWRIDPTTGETIGVMDTGFHGTASEDATMREYVDALRAFLENSRKAIRAARKARRAGKATESQRDFLKLVERVEDAITAAKPGPPV